MTNEEKMTPEEAIAEISFLKVAVNKVMEQALDMAIKALSQETTFDDECQKDMDEAWEQIQKKRKRIPVTLDLTPCDDAVSREAVIKAVDAHTNEDGTLDDDISVILEDIPFVTQNPKYWIDKDNKIYKIPDDIPQKSGKWIDHSYEEGYVECPFCGYLTNCEDNIDELHYCFYCGAKMESEDNNADSN